MACRLQDLSPELQQALLSATQRPQFAMFAAQEPSVESLHTKLLNGEILIGVHDLWSFKTTDENGEEIDIFAERLLPNQTTLLSLFAPPRPSGQSATPKASSHERGSQKRWSFIFSHPLPAHQQMEHIKAYIEWLSALQRQMHTAIPQASAQLWKMLYADKAQPQVGSSYTNCTAIVYNRPPPWVPPASRGEPHGGWFPLLARGTYRRGFSISLVFVKFACAVGITHAE